MHTLSTPWLFNCEACTIIIKPFSHFNEYDVTSVTPFGIKVLKRNLLKKLIDYKYIQSEQFTKYTKQQENILNGQFMVYKAHWIKMPLSSTSLILLKLKVGA